MRAIGNFIWFLFGGAVMGLGWWLSGLLAFATVVGIPWGKACFVIGQFAFFPFGKEALFPIGQTIVTKEVAAAARKAHADSTVAAARNYR